MLFTFQQAVRVDAIVFSELILVERQGLKLKYLCNGFVLIPSMNYFD